MKNPAILSSSAGWGYIAMPDPMGKSAVRDGILRIRRALSPKEAEGLSLRICERLMALPEYCSAARLALYSSFDSEVLTEPILNDALMGGKAVFFPRADSKRRSLEFIRVYSRADLVPGFFNIMEPCEGACESTPATELDMVLLPGVAFDRDGARLGYGMGFYDRALSGVGAQRVALAYGFQVLDEPLPVEPHDIPVDAVVTESGVLRFGRRGQACGLPDISMGIRKG